MLTLTKPTKQFNTCNGIFYSIVFFTSILFSCKKDRVTDSEVPNTGSREQLNADSLFLYAQQVYYWNDALAATSYNAFNPRQYVNSSDEELGLNNELFAIVKLANGEEYKNKATSPKYSYIFNTDDTNPTPVAYVPGSTLSVDLEGNGNDLGLVPGFYATDNTGTRYLAIIKSVDKGSPAYKAGMRRGDLILQVNGSDYGTATNGQAEQFVIDAFYNSTAATFKFKRYGASDATAKTLSLVKTAYKSNPIYQDSVYTTGNKKVGYFAFARFSHWDTNAASAIASTFTKFTNAGVTNVIIDLRYNGGGYINTCQNIASLLVPTAANGQVMYTETYNKTVSGGNATLLKNQYPEEGSKQTYYDYFASKPSFQNKFSKTGGITNIEKIVFLVTGATASSSELLINSLKPYVNDIKLVGETTYGKPIGFFPVKIGKYEVYYSLFETKNKNGEGGYYGGFTPDKDQDDIPTKDFGDLTESLIAPAYAYIQNGSFTIATNTSSARGVSPGVTTKLKAMSFDAPKGEFKGMVKRIDISK